MRKRNKNAKPQTETLQFKKWFKDSKAVDENGEPPMVYHGSKEKFTIFNKGEKNGFPFADHFAAVANIDKLFKNGTLVDDRADKSGDPNIVSIKRFVAPVLLGDDFAEAYITVKETAGNKVYSWELDELKKPSDITGGTLKERYHIPEGDNKLLQKIEKAREVLKKINFPSPATLIWATPHFLRSTTAGA